MSQSRREGSGRQVARLERIIEISRALNSTLSLRPLLQQLLEAAQELTSTAASSIMLLDRKTGELHFEAATGARSEQVQSVVVPLEGSVAGWVVQNELPLVIPDARNDPRFYQDVDKQIGFETRSLLAVPLAVRGRMIGVLEAVNKEDGAPFTDEDVRTLSALADQAAVAIENAVLFQQSDLVSEIVHEMRTPLTSIAGYAEMIRREGISAEERDDFARTIVREALRLSDMADSFLELARLESGRALVAREPVALDRVIDEALAVLRPQAEGRQIALDVDTPDTLPTVIGDPQRLKQTMINLLDNAVKYSHRGDRVTVTGQVREDEVVIGVVDTGPGIPREAHERLFGKFYRHPSAEGKAEGAGLGLAITRQIIESHGGSIWAESEEGKGTAFFFTLPIPPE